MSEEKRPPGRPVSGVTPKRNIRIGDEWDELAALTGEKMTNVIKRLVAAEVRRLRRLSQRTAS